jgi:hypothetical protein
LLKNGGERSLLRLRRFLDRDRFQWGHMRRARPSAASASSKTLVSTVRGGRATAPAMTGGSEPNGSTRSSHVPIPSRPSTSRGSRILSTAIGRVGNRLGPEE